MSDFTESLVNAIAMRTHSRGNATQLMVVMRGGFL